MRIGELAAQTGMSKDTLRFYEKIGLVEGDRLANGYRDFAPEMVTWLHYVRTAQVLGFSLAEIIEHGDQLRDAPDSAEALSALLAGKVGVIDQRMAELAALRADLTTRIGTGCPLRPVGQPAPAMS
ncbi:MerR family DNA-binding transcriptional regulator [Kribbella albertanoniae]|uniref:MerR family transcriptional regulator n=1 Tax=Kribbella albertanoniae TaxID=1266829 RepID=A0A4R4PYK5_9ACTN|nr:MerR family transcriptional regulator [Kribbella albertanoniae]TDC27686.1 MerR family transcriptional regulator [Kribbella albertanoniae]